eukprot:scpid110716/ scgid27554/ 
MCVTWCVSICIHLKGFAWNDCYNMPCLLQHCLLQHNTAALLTAAEHYSRALQQRTTVCDLLLIIHNMTYVLTASRMLMDQNCLYTVIAAVVRVPTEIRNRPLLHRCTYVVEPMEYMYMQVLPHTHAHT